MSEWAAFFQDPGTLLAILSAAWVTGAFVGAVISMLSAVIPRG